jgi:hypothetical protein
MVREISWNRLDLGSKIDQLSNKSSEANFSRLTAFYNPKNSASSAIERFSFCCNTANARSKRDKKKAQSNRKELF